MYDIIYDFIYNSLINTHSLDSYSTSILGVDTNMAVWLSHSLTIIGIILFFIFCYLFVRYFFRLGASLLNFR